MEFTQVICGALVGLLVGLTGVGGGSLMTPILLLFLGVPPLTAVGTDLCFAALTKTVASRWYYQKKLIDWEVVRTLWTGSVPATICALVVIRLTDLPGRAPEIITHAVGLAILLSGMGLLWQVRRALLASATQIEPNDADVQPLTPMQRRLTRAWGFAMGLLVTFTSVGAGAVGIVVLTVLYRQRLNIRKLVACDVVHAVPLGAFAGIGHWIVGDIQYSLLGYLLLGSIPMVLIGSWLASRIPQVWLRLILCMILWLVGARLLA